MRLKAAGPKAVIFGLSRVGGVVLFRPTVFRLEAFRGRCCDIHHTKPHKAVIWAERTPPRAGPKSGCIASHPSARVLLLAGDNGASAPAQPGCGVSKPRFYR